MQATKEKPLVVIIDAQDECFDMPLTQFPNLGIKTFHANCLDFSQAAFNGSIEEILSRRPEEKRYAIFHFSLGGRNADYTAEQNAEADKMDRHIQSCLKAYGFEVTGIDAVDNACSLKMVNRINEILAS
jgi:hypothetical protein